MRSIELFALLDIKLLDHGDFAEDMLMKIIRKMKVKLSCQWPNDLNKHSSSRLRSCIAMPHTLATHRQAVRTR